MTTLPERRQVLDELNTLAIQDVSELWRQSSGLDSAGFRALIIEAFPELVDPYAAAASELATVWYDDSAPALPYRATPAALPPVEQLASSASWALGATGDAALSRLAGTMQRAIYGASRQTIVENAQTERGATWARHASANACEFCRMLATRGDVYASESSATQVGGRGMDVSATRDPVTGKRKSGGQAKGVKARGTQALGDRYHDHCHCMAVQVRPGQSYEPPSYVEAWEQQYIDAVRATSGKGEYGAIDVKAVLAHMAKA